MKCPKCGSTNINQYRMPTGPIWCMDCPYQVLHKEKDHSFGNPVIDYPAFSPEAPKAPKPLCKYNMDSCIHEGTDDCNQCFPEHYNTTP